MENDFFSLPVVSMVESLLCLTGTTFAIPAPCVRIVPIPSKKSRDKLANFRQIYYALCLKDLNSWKESGDIIPLKPEIILVQKDKRKLSPQLRKSFAIFQLCQTFTSAQQSSIVHFLDLRFENFKGNWDKDPKDHRGFRATINRIPLPS